MITTMETQANTRPFYHFTKDQIQVSNSTGGTGLGLMAKFHVNQ